MDKVTPKKILSPWSGDWCTPKIVTRDYQDRIVKEAHWYCPSSGQFITKGVVETVMKQPPKDEPKQ